MTSEIPKMPEVHTLRRHEATQTLREWGCDLAARLEASNTLCAELEEALEVARDAMNERRSYVNGGDPSGCWQEMKHGAVWDEEDARVSSALAKFKEPRP